MEGSPIDEALTEARHQFQTPAGEVERGLDVDAPATLQLRKACRLIDATERLAERNGHHTVVIEASFAAIERSIQFYLLDTGYLDQDDYVGHEQVYELGTSVGLYDESFEDRLRSLWRNNRSRTYYREGIGTAPRAAAMTNLVRALHAHVTELAGRRHDCLCS